MSAKVSDFPVLLLAMPKHGLEALGVERYGGSRDSHTRYLNALGRWAVHGLPASPLLAWPLDEREDAHRAAAVASANRTRAVAAVPRVLGAAEVVMFGHQHEPALLGPLATDADGTAKLGADLARLVDFTEALFGAFGGENVSDADRERAKAVARERLRGKHDGMSFTSAIAWLLGPGGLRTLEAADAGAVEMEVGVLQRAYRGVELAVALKARQARGERLG